MKHAPLRAPLTAVELPDSEVFELQSLAALAALAQHTRLRVFRLLVEREPHGMAAGAIAESVQAPQNTISSHLSILARGDLVMSERRGRSIVYRANLQKMRTLIEYLVANCCQGKATCDITPLTEFCPSPACAPKRR